MFSLVILAGLTALAVSQDNPLCGQKCQGIVASDQGSCSGGDTKCLCNNADYESSLLCCLSTNCAALSDQILAVTYISKLCSSAGITLSPLLECRATMLSGTSKFISSSTSFSLANQGGISTAISTATSTTTPIKIGSAVSIPSIAPLAQFTGGALLTDLCAAPEFLQTINGSAVIEYPWVGCSYERLSCCPFDISTGGLLSVCPQDYISTSSACCPSGWSVYSTALAAEQTPCYSIPFLPLFPPTPSLIVNGSINIISTKIFTLKYNLQLSPQQSSFSSGAKAGVAIGVLLGILLAVAIGLVLLRRRRRRRQKGAADTTTPGDMKIASPSPVPAFAPFFLKNRRSRKHRPVDEKEMVTIGDDNDNRTLTELNPPLDDIAEMPSPGTVDGYRRSFIPPMSPTPSELPGELPSEISLQKPAQPPEELPGDTWMNEHHPAYNIRREGAVIPRRSEAAVMSPLASPSGMETAK